MTALIRTSGFASCEGVPGVDLEVVPGELLALTGADGERLHHCLRVLAGVEAPPCGRLELLDVSTEDMDESQWLSLRRRTGLVTARAPLLSTLSARLNVMLPMNYHRAGDRTNARECSDRVLDELGFDGERNSLPADLKPAERFYVQLARELILDPEILFIEEPFSLHDVGEWPSLGQRLIDLATRRHVALVIATANLAFIQRHAERCLFLGEETFELLATEDMFAGHGSSESRQFLATTTTWPREPAA